MNQNVETIISQADGKNVISFVPDNSRSIAIVDLKVLLKLVTQLPSVPLDKIKEALIHEMQDTLNIEEYIALLEEEIAFHKSVNLIEEHNTSNPAVIVVGHDSMHMVSASDNRFLYNNPNTGTRIYGDIDAFLTERLDREEVYTLVIKKHKDGWRAEEPSY